MKLTPQTKIVIVGNGDISEVSLRHHFTANGFLQVYPEKAFDPLHSGSTRDFFERERPDIVILTSVRSGGIGVNQEKPAEFIHDNLMAQMNVIDTSYRAGVKKLLFLAASCVYPKQCPQPIKEEYFLTGAMESSSLAYSTAKAAGVVMCQAYHRQYGFNAIVAVPATVYGPGGHANIEEAHVLGALIGKFDRAVREGVPAVGLWGTGEPKREFIFGNDLAAACVFLLEDYDDEGIINIGRSEEISIKELARIVADAAGFKGDIIWDATKPDGTMRKLLDTSHLRSMGWMAKMPLREGIVKTFAALRHGR
ncbi:MAG: GDP-L-fucose synthase [Candidatus Omnitrophica bacterium]|nr:GDP-L-fucose synthase [Candidatus Omnitrophota bacterium]